MSVHRWDDDKAFTLRRKDVGSFYPFTDERVYPSAGAGLWTTANDQYKFYKMLLNYGIGYNGPAWGDQLEAASEAFFRSVGVDIRREDEKPKPVPGKTSANAERGEIVL